MQAYGQRAVMRIVLRRMQGAVRSKVLLSASDADTLASLCRMFNRLGRLCFVGGKVGVRERGSR